MTRALDSSIGLPSRPRSASWMLVFAMPEDVSRSSTAFPLYRAVTSGNSPGWRPDSGEAGAAPGCLTGYSRRRRTFWSMNPDTAVADPDALAAELGSRVEEATKRLEQTAAETTDDQARAPSQLPDWSRGHVLTHLARNADGLRNLLVWARTGVETPQYPSVQARNDGIEAGAGRRAAELAADIAESAAQFAAEAARLSGP